jgi:hypothetical protein
MNVLLGEIVAFCRERRGVGDGCSEPIGGSCGVSKVMCRAS